LKHSIQYRPDIDGLRALAIVPVVFFHLDPSIAPGGFVGVDVFFVISGYLITSIIFRELTEQRFSFAYFYERRIRRIIPALATVTGCSFVAAWFLFLPGDFRAFSESLAATGLFVANLFFWKKTDYFADPVDSIPLLHMWSLAVEEQFYLFFPPLLLLLVRFRPKWLQGVLAIALLFSLGTAQFVLSQKPESAFYFLHLRAWELLAGAFLAVGGGPAGMARRFGNVLALAGLLMVCGSFFLLGATTKFPGFSAVPAVLGTALLIHAGTGTHTLPGKLLSTKPFVRLGQLSYSLYLWHWPLIVFVRYYLPPPDSAVLQNLLLLTAAIGISALSWKFVERPFRHSGDREGRRRMYLLAAVVILSSIFLSLPGILSGDSGRVPAHVAAVAATAREEIPFRRPCFGLRPEQVAADAPVCAMGKGDRPEFLLWGDSHALAMAHGIDRAAVELGKSGRFLGISACPPGREASNKSPGGACQAFNQAVRDYLLRNPSIRTIVLAGYWSHYYAQPEPETFEANLQRLLRELADKDYRVVVIGQAPEPGWNVPSVLARSLWYGHRLPAASTREQHMARHERFHAMIQKGHAGRVTLVNVADRLCPGGTCVVESQGAVLYRDGHHLSKAGSGLLTPQMRSELFGDPGPGSIGGAR